MRVCLMIEGQEGVTWDDWARLARLTEEHGLEGLFRSDHYTAIIRPDADALDAWATLAGARGRSPTGSGSGRWSRRRRSAIRACSREWPRRSITSRAAVSRSAWARGGTSASTTRTGFRSSTRKQRFELFAEQVEVVVRSWTEESVRPRRPRVHAPRASMRFRARPAAPPAAHPRRHRQAEVRRARRPLRDRGEHARRTQRRAARAERARSTGPARRRVAIPASLGYSVMTTCFVGRDRAEAVERVARFLAIRDDDTDPGALLAERRDRWLVGTRGRGRRADRRAASARRHARLPPAPEPRRRRHGRARGRTAAAAAQVASSPMTTTELTGAEEIAWDLSDLYESGDDPRIEQDLQETETAAAAFRERYYGRVAELSAARAGARRSRSRERIESIFTRAIYYAHLWFSTDMADAPRGALVARLTEKGATLDTQLLFFGLEIAALDDDVADALAADEALERWRHWLSTDPQVPAVRPHRARGEDPHREVGVRLRAPGTGSTTSSSARSRSTSTGRRSASRRRWRSSTRADRDERRRAAEAVTAALEPGLRTRTFVFNTIVVDKSIDDRLRGLRDLDLGAQPLERHDGRGGAGARRRGRRPLRRRPALLPAEGAAARARPARVLRPHGADRRRSDAGLLGRGVASVVLDAYADFSDRDRATSSSASSARAGSTRRRATTSGTARSARRTSPACTRTSS